MAESFSDRLKRIKQGGGGGVVTAPAGGQWPAGSGGMDAGGPKPAGVSPSTDKPVKQIQLGPLSMNIRKKQKPTATAYLGIRG